ncbi:hypothetical protein CC79DRAFT_1330128 [Sarocladium strictum]
MALRLGAFPALAVGVVAGFCLGCTEGMDGRIGRVEWDFGASWVLDLGCLDLGCRDVGCKQAR